MKSSQAEPAGQTKSTAIPREDEQTRCVLACADCQFGVSSRLPNLLFSFCKDACFPLPTYAEPEFYSAVVALQSASVHAWHGTVQVQQGNGAGEAQAADAPLPTGRLLTYADITPALKGRQAEVCVCLSLGGHSVNIYKSMLLPGACCDFLMGLCSCIGRMTRCGILLRCMPSTSGAE